VFSRAVAIMNGILVVYQEAIPLPTRTQRLVLAALFAALTAAGAFIRVSVPPVPFTLQVLFAMWSGLLLGPRLGLASQIGYLITGLVGVPVFSNGGGVGYVVSPTFGYLLGLAAGAYVAGTLSRGRGPSKPGFWRLFAAALAGLAATYAIGVPYLYLILNKVVGAPLSLSAAIIRGCLLFLPWDVAKMALAAWLAAAILRRLPTQDGSPSI
jgi:biotin transport system substrate-specific component